MHPESEVFDTHTFTQSSFYVGCVWLEMSVSRRDISCRGINLSTCSILLGTDSRNILSDSRLLSPYMELVCVIHQLEERHSHRRCHISSSSSSLQIVILHSLRDGKEHRVVQNLFSNYTVYIISDSPTSHDSRAGLHHPLQ